MGNPKFAVGEEVLVLSKVLSPGNWFDLVITEIIYESNGWESAQGYIYPAGYKYIFKSGRSVPEKRVRKKHQPSSESFDQIMQGLKKGVSA